MAYVTILILGILLFLFVANFMCVFSSQQVSALPVKVNLEIKRTINFLKLGVILKNESAESLFVKVKLVILKKGNSNASRIAQSKELKLSGYEMVLPFLTEFSINSEDSLEIILQIYDREGNLRLERIFESEGKGHDEERFF